MTKILLPTTKATGEYYGHALLSFINAMEVDSIRNKILSNCGLESISPETWYDLEIARKIYFGAEQFAGPSSIKYTGTKIIKYALFPPGIKTIQDVLDSILVAYQMNTKGENLGTIEHKVVSTNQSEITFSTPFPCKLDEGIIIGCVQKFGEIPEVTHTHNKCRSSGDSSCTYIITW